MVIYRSHFGFHESKLALVNCVSEPIYGNCQSCHQKLDNCHIWEYGCYLHWIHTILDVLSTICTFNRKLQPQYRGPHCTRHLHHFFLLAIPTIRQCAKFVDAFNIFELDFDWFHLLISHTIWMRIYVTHTHTFRRSWKYFQLSNPEQCSVPESDIIWNADRNLFCQRINTRIHKWIYKKWKRHSFVRRFYRILRYSLAQKNIRINSKNSFKINFNFFLFFLPNNKCHTGKAAKIPQWKILSVIWPDDDEDAWQCI